MNKKTFKIYNIIIIIIVAVVVAISVNYDNWYLPIIAILAIGAFKYVLREKTKKEEILADERDYKIAGVASLWSMQTYVSISVIAGLILYILGDRGDTMFVAGSVLLYSSFFLMVLYSILFKIYEKKHERD